MQLREMKVLWLPAVQVPELARIAEPSVLAIEDTDLERVLRYVGGLELTDAPDAPVDLLHVPPDIDRDQVIEEIQDGVREAVRRLAGEDRPLAADEARLIYDDPMVATLTNLEGFEEGHPLPERITGQTTTRERVAARLREVANRREAEERERDERAPGRWTVDFDRQQAKTESGQQPLSPVSQKLRISDHAISNQEIRELLSQLTDIQDAAIYFRKSTAPVDWKPEGQDGPWFAIVVRGGPVQKRVRSLKFGRTYTLTTAEQSGRIPETIGIETEALTDENGEAWCCRIGRIFYIYTNFGVSLSRHMFFLAESQLKLIFLRMRQLDPQKLEKEEEQRFSIKNRVNLAKFVDLCSQRHKAQFDNTKQEYDRGQEELHRTTSRVAHLLREAERLSKTLEMLKGTGDKAGLEQEFQQIVSREDVEALYVDGNSLVFETKELLCSGKLGSFVLGRMKVIINFRDNDIHFKNLDGGMTISHTKWEHPHSNRGRVCWGNLSNAISKMIATYEVLGIVETTIRFLKTYNHRDEYGRRAKYWVEREKKRGNQRDTNAKARSA